MTVTDYRVGETVQIVNPTGGVQRDDRFTVIAAPDERGASGLVWVAYAGLPAGGRWTTSGRPLGFHPTSLRRVPS